MATVAKHKVKGSLYYEKMDQPIEVFVEIFLQKEVSENTAFSLTTFLSILDSEKYLPMIPIKIKKYTDPLKAWYGFEEAVNEVRVVCKFEVDVEFLKKKVGV